MIPSFNIQNVANCSNSQGRSTRSLTFEETRCNNGGSITHYTYGKSRRNEPSRREGSPENDIEQLSPIIEIVMVVWCFVIALLMIGNTFQLAYKWITKKLMKELKKN
ncbi:hypothetical protein H5410_042470 [Solanum commersonii]|uniref:Uncharacterized protein n=1 Tax=Solanum commersonii TaxID=4109 RepID=A0A9J5XXQ1_SOLCO|nr:hypothetical protein H5410_042470 [Solanum commersonii]